MYDAILFKNTVSGGASHRINAGLDLAELHIGKPAHIREVGGGMTLGTKNSGDTLLFPKTHDLSGQPRYNWEPGPDGIQLGTLKEEAKTP